MRADLYLHQVRLFKTRSLATQACTKGQVEINGDPVKPARNLRVGDLITVKRPFLTLTVRALDFPAHRIGAPMVPQFMEDLTPQEDYLKAAEMRRENVMQQPHETAAKPNKKQLREIRKLMETFDNESAMSNPQNA